MRSSESPTGEESQKCILSCKDSKIFYCFPAKQIMRNVWLYKLGLDDDDFYPNPTVCNRHFSEKMFDSNKKLKSNAVPDMNLPATLSSPKSKSSNSSTFPVQKKLPVKERAPRTEIDNLQSKPKRVRNKPQIETPRQSRKNDASNSLVDYELKVRGNHLCDIVEVPQYIVVFTVVKAKPNNIITPKNTESKKKVTPAKRQIPSNSIQSQDIITIEDDDDDHIRLSKKIIKPAVSRLSKITVPKPGGMVQKIPQVIQSCIQTQVPISNRQSLELVLKNTEYGNILKENFDVSKPMQVETTPQKAQENITSKATPNLPEIKKKQISNVGLQVKTPKVTDIIPPKFPAVVSQKIPEVIYPKSPDLPYMKIQDHEAHKKPPAVLQQPQTELDIVYYTPSSIAPRRDRAIQVNLSRKLNTAAIQCDYYLDKDIMEMSSANDDSHVKEVSIKKDQSSTSLQECLFCGEILSKATKIRHDDAHKPSLCCQCGKMFSCKFKLTNHAKNVHSENLSRLYRCPKRNCFKAFHSMKLLNMHIQEHIRTKEHKCPKCLQCFRSSMKLICHQRALDKCLRTRGWTSRRWSKRL